MSRQKHRLADLFLLFMHSSLVIVNVHPVPVDRLVTTPPRPHPSPVQRLQQTVVLQSLHLCNAFMTPPQRHPPTEHGSRASLSWCQFVVAKRGEEGRQSGGPRPLGIALLSVRLC